MSCVSRDLTHSASYIDSVIMIRLFYRLCPCDAEYDTTLLAVDSNCMFQYNQTLLETNRSGQLVQFGAYRSPSPVAHPGLSPSLLCLHLYLWKSDEKERTGKKKCNNQPKASITRRRET